ncbi:GyrI-like domain-containing protein [Marinicrinis sediminis]|uniref:GyrI-like domain-containing protein n=1 Tax=Marinicrinis sediminis TaxID=1652465 RepID=A0ABW5R9J2_9BACL
MMKQDKFNELKTQNELKTDNEMITHHEPVRIEEFPSFSLAGISVVTTNAAEISGNGKIARLFDQFYSRNIAHQLSPYQQKSGIYSCYFNYENGDSGAYEVMVGVHVHLGLEESVPADLNIFTVPAAKYAVFVTEQGPIVEVIQQAWGRIWEWSQKPGNERAFSGDFEYYSPHIDPNHGQAEIYIALR